MLMKSLEEMVDGFKILHRIIFSPVGTSFYPGIVYKVFTKDEYVPIEVYTLLLF